MTTVTSTRERFERAVDTLIERVREDRHLLAVILFGSLSYDTVWDRSDIDLLLVSEDKAVPHGGVGGDQCFCLTEEGVVIHAFMQPRAEYKRMMHGTLQGSFIHSSIARSRLLFTRDESLRELHENLHRIGSRDRAAQLFHAAGCALAPLTKAISATIRGSSRRGTPIW